MPAITDSDCIAAVLSGNTQQYALLVNRYKDLIYTLCARCLPSVELAEEAAQDSFLKAFKSLSQFNKKAKFSTWLYRIAYNTCMDYLKKKAIATDQLNYNYVEEVGEEASVLHKLHDEERTEAILKAMDRLAKEDRFVLTLYYYEELSTEELAEVLGISPNYAKQKLFRARKQLGQIIEEHATELINDYE